MGSIENCYMWGRLYIEILIDNKWNSIKSSSFELRVTALIIWMTPTYYCVGDEYCVWLWHIYKGIYKGKHEIRNFTCWKIQNPFLNEIHLYTKAN